MALGQKPKTRPAGPAALTILGGALAVTIAACGSSASSASATSHHSGSPSPHMSEHMTGHAMMTIGTDCGMIPSAGMGSMHGMASEPVATAASHDPLVTKFAADVQKAGLTSTLNSAHGITVFAADNQAFSKLSSHDMAMMSGQAELAKVLNYHVVRGQITPADFAQGKTLTTLEGGKLKVSKMGSTYEVNNAAITCGNLHTANATVYIINTVLTPMH